MSGSRITEMRARVRSAFLRKARDMARSGEHQDHRTIISLLQAEEGYADVAPLFGDPDFRNQLNRMCDHARQEHVRRR